MRFDFETNPKLALPDHDAEEIFTRIVKTSEAHPGNGDSRLGFALISLGRLETQEHRFDAAQLTLDRAMALLEKTDGKASATYAESLSAVAQLRAAEGRPEEAATLHEETARIRSAAQGESHPHALTDLTAWADVLKRLGQTDRARELEARVRDARSTKR